MFTLVRPAIVAPVVGITLGVLTALLLTHNIRVCRPVRSLLQTSPGSIGSLAERLKPFGFRVVPVAGTEDLEQGAFFTATDKSPEELAAMSWGDESEEGREKWKGTLRVRHLANWYGDVHEDIQLPGESAWRWGRFLFFGDVELLNHVKQHLGESEIDDLIPTEMHQPQNAEK